MREITQSDAIREALLQNPSATNLQVKRYCRTTYNIHPSSALIFEVVGSCKRRGLNTITAAQFIEIKTFAKDNFSGDMDRFLSGVAAVRAAQ